MSEHGLTLLEPITARVAMWRQRHRAHARRVQTYRVVYDGSTVAELSAVSASTLDEELAAAAWELAQGLARAVTVDVLAFDAQDVELARMPLRVMPVAPPTAATGDMQSVVKVLLESNQAQGRLILEMCGAFTSQLREASAITAELARGAFARARSAEIETTMAAETVRDALAVARDNTEPKRTTSDRMADLIEGFIAERRRDIGRPAAQAAPVEAAPVEAAPVEAVEGEVIS